MNLESQNRKPPNAACRGGWNIGPIKAYYIARSSNRVVTIEVVSQPKTGVFIIDHPPIRFRNERSAWV